MSYDINLIYDLYSYPYDTDRSDFSYAEFLINSKSYIPLRPPLYENTTITSLLPVEGVNIPFDISDGKLIFDDKWYGSLAYIKQRSSNINGKILTNHMGNELILEESLPHTILDGGHVIINNDGDIEISPGLVRSKYNIHSFCGLNWPLSSHIITLPKGRGMSIALFFVLDDNAIKRGSKLIIHTVATDLIINQVGDYSTMYNVIKSLYSVDFKSSDYLELYRGQFISQSPSTPYIRGHLDMRMRKPSVENYPGN